MLRDHHNPSGCARATTCISASIGLSADLAAGLTSEAKKRWGKLAYALTALKVLMRARPFRATIISSRGEEKVKTLQIAVGNGRHYGGGTVIEENAAILSKAGVCVAIHSDEQRLVQRLNVESAVAIAAGRRAGIDISQEEAIKWITINPAKIMGIADKTGSLEPGKMADVVLWSKNPFSVYAIAEKVFIDGALVLDTSDPATRYKSDFEIGQPVGEE